MNRTNIIYFFILSFSFLKIYSQEKYSFDYFLNIALINNLQLKEASYEQVIAGFEVKEKKSDFYPTFSASIASRNSYGRSIDPYSNSFVDSQFKSYTGGLSSSLVLFNGLYKLKSLKLAQNEFTLKETLFEKIKNDITIELAKLYTSILYMEELVEAAKEQIKLSREQLGYLTFKFEEGLISASEIYRIQTQIATENNELINKENSLDLMYLDLEFLLNESELSRNILKPLDLVVINRNFDKILDIEEISKNDPMFRVSKIKEENSKIAIDILRASQMPSLSIQLNYNSFYSDSNEEYNFSQQWENNKNYGFSFVLSIPIFNGFLVKNKIRKEKIYYSQAKIKTNIEKNVIERILKQANVDFESLNNKVLSSELAVEYSKKTYDADLVKFEFGKLSLSDLLISQKIYYQNQSELIKYKYEYLYSKALLGFYNNNVFIFN